MAAVFFFFSFSRWFYDLKLLCGVLSLPNAFRAVPSNRISSVQVTLSQRENVSEGTQNNPNRSQRGVV